MPPQPPPASGRGEQQGIEPLPPDCAGGSLSCVKQGEGMSSQEENGEESARAVGGMKAQMAWNEALGVTSGAWRAGHGEDLVQRTP